MANFNEARVLDLAGHLPPVLRGVREIEAIMAAEQPDVALLWRAAEDALDNQFLESATEHGIARRESMLTIVPFSSDTLDDRRFRLQTRYNENIPYTRRGLMLLLEALCGREGYDIAFKTEALTVDVKVALVAKKQTLAVAEMLERILPYEMAFSVTLKYNRHDTLAAFTHGHLAGCTQEQLRSEVLR